jgi:hypothetical protein
MKFNKLLLIPFAFFLISNVFGQEPEATSEDLPPLGIYPKVSYNNPSSLNFKSLKKKLPKPIVADKALLEMYYKAWENAFNEIEIPKAGSKLKNAYIKPVDSANLSMWHTEMSMHFWKYGTNAFDAGQAMDNFFDLQQMDGFLGRQIDPKLGSYISKDQRKASSDPPLLAWAEWEWFKHTGDSIRAKRVTDPLSFQIEWLELNKALPNEANNSYFWTTQASAGISDIPRSTVSQIDIASQMVINYKYAYNMIGLSNNSAFQDSYKERMNQLRQIIGTQFYDPKRNVFADLNAKRKPETLATINGYWTLLAEIPNDRQKTLMLRNLENQAIWNAPYPFPVTIKESSSDKEIASYGELNFMVIQGLKAIGKTTLANNFANKILDNQLNSFKKTKKLYSKYNAYTSEPAKGSSDKTTLGSNLVAINFLIENYLGFEVEGNKQQLTWNLNRTDAHGIENLLVGNAIVTIKANARKEVSDEVVVKGKTTAPFALYLKVGDRVFYKRFEKGNFTIKL